MLKTFQTITLLSLVMGLSFSQYTWAEKTEKTSEPKSEQISKTTPFTIGETTTWHSEILDEQRTVNVYLPQSYTSNKQQTYPVIYLLDGSADEDFIHIAGLVQFGSFSWIKMMPESIVVGIANVDRKHDFTFPSSLELDQKEFPTSGGSEDFIEFIAKELQPKINQQYRVQGDNSTLMGQSLGGLLATEILFNHPDMFNQYMIISPSLWWDKGSMIRNEYKLTFKNKTVFVGVGKEGPTMEGAARKLHEKLSPYKTNNNRIGFGYFEQLDHGDTLHQAAYAGFEFLFQKAETAK